MKIPEFTKASEAAAWIAKKISKKNWGVGSYGEGTEKVVSDLDTEALRSLKDAKYCALGWMWVADGGFEDEIRDTFRDVIGSYGVATWNDRQFSHLAVKAAFKETAKRLSERES